jgi:glucosamine--fructose-6-phosphate aminotransferase (isomerizing)
MIENTHLYKEIHEQPEVLEYLLNNERDKIIEIASLIDKLKPSNVIIAARGTSDNVGRYAKYLLGAENGLNVGLAAPSLFTIYKKPPRFKNSLVMGISQSGQSPDIVAVLAEAQRQGAQTLAITNDPESPLADTVDMTVNLHAGVEKSVAATKTYTTSLLAVAMLSAALSKSAAMWDALDGIPKAVLKTLEIDPLAVIAASRWRFTNRCVVIGRGFNYASAFEIALKLKELTYIIAEPYSPADLLHGPFAIVERDFPVIVIAPNGAILPNIKKLLEDLCQTGADTLIISDDKDTLNMGDLPLRLPYPLPEWLSPIASIVAGQLFALRLTETKKLDIDRPRRLKKVTRTH